MTPTPGRWACVIGQPIRFSLSPALHNAAFAALGVDAHYDAIEVAAEELPPLLERLRAPECMGANVTAPHKAAVMPLVDGVLAEARLLGVANTLVNRDGRLLADNTDAQGLARWMDAADIRVAGGAALVLGAGGAARATVLALARRGAREILVRNRTPQRALELVADLAPHLPGIGLSGGPLEDAARPASEPAAVVVNATSLGHHGGAPAVHASWYSDRSVAVELVYNPWETAFLQTARAQGVRGENGLGMLVHQAILAFQAWTGLSPSAAVMEAAALKALRAAAPAGTGAAS